MKTDAVTAADLARSVIAVPPLARARNGAVSVEENRKIVGWMATGGVSTFLYGGNAAYIEDLHARYEADPNSVDAEWQSFFQSLKDDPKSVIQNARGAPLLNLSYTTEEEAKRAEALLRQALENAVDVMSFKEIF